MEVSVPVGDDFLWVEDSGGDGVPVVLLHGDWTDSGIWASLVPLLRERYRVIRYDLRGFGRSSRAEQPFTRVGDLRALLDHCGVGDAVVVGHSGGGGTALELALLHPRRVRSLVLVAPGIHDHPWPTDDPYFRECDAMIAAEDLDGLVRLGLRTWAPAGADGAVAGMLRGAVSSWFELGELELPGPPAFGRLGEVRVPATMLLGELEYPMVAEVSRAVAMRLDGCPTVLVPGADHLLPLRAADRLAAAVAEAAGEP